ncbi:VCBS repeat-containing protein [Flammeovirga sp. OC4]|uniref:FG-GAP repeat domain-containing protein n=1 Tax=Flammeovirga sp. OC4 TaxID=1382345 RepID=UPI0005C6009C|nr:VCBS repeat-containing protein [Flammeovirga sp. OC4]
MDKEALDIHGYLNDGTVKIPKFKKITLAENQKDGYWISAIDINGNGKLDIVTSGLAEGEVVWYENPTWEKRLIAKFPEPVAIDVADIAGNGRKDLVISHNFGTCAFWCRPEDGKISWLENPGKYEENTPWKRHFVSDLLATHRVKLGYFTQSENLELLGIPVVGCKPYGEGIHQPIAMTLFDRPKDPTNAGDWKGRVINDTDFRLVHDVLLGKYGGYSGEKHDSMLICSEEGLTWFYYNIETGKWDSAPLSEGDREYEDIGFTGCSNIAYGKLGDDPYGYMVSLDPFHGNKLALYTRRNKGGIADGPWTRKVIDTYGDFDAQGQGATHHVICADFDGDGDDEFLVALRGPMPNQGVYYYKVIDLEQGLIERWRVSTASASLIVIGDFNGDGRLDFATTSYYTPGFFLCDNAQVNVFINDFA